MLRHRPDRHWLLTIRVVDFLFRVFIVKSEAQCAWSVVDDAAYRLFVTGSLTRLEG
jgi:hypothetical protein